MRIPDEAKYTEDMQRIEDTEGYVSCIHCYSCPLTEFDQIYADGSWRCAMRNEKRRGDNVLEYRCAYFFQKTCMYCLHYKKDGMCALDSTGKKIGHNPLATFCKSWKSRSWKGLEKTITGKKRKLSTKAKAGAIKREAEYIKQRIDKLVEEGEDIPMTIREMEFSGNVENINKAKEIVCSWGANRYPATLKKIKSKSQLQKKVNEFFQTHPLSDDIAMPPQVNELAVYLGLAGKHELMQIIENISPTRDVEVQRILMRAVDLIDGAWEQRMMEIASAQGDFRGVAEMLKRQDKLAERYSELYARREEREDLRRIKEEAEERKLQQAREKITRGDNLVSILKDKMDLLAQSIDVTYTETEPVKSEIPEQEATDGNNKA